MHQAHDALFWVHFASAVLGVGVYVGAVFIFRWFALRSLYRPTCIALCWVFTALAFLLAGHTIGQLVRGLETVLQLVDIGTRIVVAVAVYSIWLDTRRQPLAKILSSVAEAGR